ncbi:MAG: hypothetical protein MH472_03490 [Bacteroidia bacterium]|nr:hypothetical protein [Bacteroidia bacterium]
MKITHKLQLKFIFLLSLIFVSNISFGQNKYNSCWGTLDSADKIFFKKDYENALLYYESFFESPCSFDDPLLYYKLAYSAHHSGKFQEAIQYYTFGLNLINFQPESFRDKNWKKEFIPTNRFDLFEIGYEIIRDDSLNEYIYTKTKGAYHLKAQKSDLMIHRAQCKIALEDYIGAIKDLKKYHNIIQDSSALSNYLLGVALLQPTSVKIENKVNMQLAIKYFSMSIKLYEKPGPFNSEYSICRDSYYYRAISNMMLNKKQAACEDFSTAGEMGKKEAFGSIKQYCQ